jgi:glycopeptide antibiotics resistance protein
MPRSKAAAAIALVLSLVLIVAVTLSPTTGEPQTFQWRPVISRERFVEAVFNALLFAPLGATTRLFGFPQWATAAIAASVAVAIEMIQLFVLAGRYAELQDIVANTLGAWAGWVILDRWFATTPNSPTS